MPDCRRLLLGLLAAVVLLIPTAQAQETLVVDLSENVVAITTGFVGSSLLLFGAAEGPGDIVVVVRGPLVDTVVRRKEKMAGVWVNRTEMTFEDTPEFYAVASNRSMTEFLSQATRHAYQLGVDYLDLHPAAASENAGDDADFRTALIRNKQRQALYQTQPGNVQFIGSRLFRTRIQFPANVTVGTYGVDVYLFRNDKPIGVRTTLINVRKFGAEAAIYDFAHRQSLAYGVLAVLIAVMAGWLANVVFKR